MQEEFIKDILTKLQKGEIDVDKGLAALKHMNYEDLGFAKIDHHRALRQGFPEVIYCPGKTTEHIVKIASRLAESNGNLLATRANPEAFTALQKILPDVQYNEASRTIYLHRNKTLMGQGTVLVMSAGTADMPVAEEAAVTAEIMGNKVDRLYDVGVAGIHRLFDNKDKIMAARVIVVAAGMEGALASVVGGLVDIPLIAVPTSVGYGANFQGLSALLTMLNSCSAGISVVNIDNGFGAGYAASLINRKVK